MSVRVSEKEISERGEEGERGLLIEGRCRV